MPALELSGVTPAIRPTASSAIRHETRSPLARQNSTTTAVLSRSWTSSAVRRKMLEHDAEALVEVCPLAQAFRNIRCVSSRCRICGSVVGMATDGLRHHSAALQRNSTHFNEPESITSPSN